MNAAILLVTSAWLAGQDAPPPAAKPAPPPPAHAAPAPAAPSACCDSGCDSCCESGGFFARLRGWFHRHDDCCDTCDTGGHHAAPPPPPPAHKESCAASCGDDCCGGGFLARLRGWFHRHDSCDECATDCCGTAAAPTGPPPRPPEPIQAPKSTEPPKAMPKGSTSGAGLLLPQPALSPATNLIINR